MPVTALVSDRARTPGMRPAASRRSGSAAPPKPNPKMVVVMPSAPASSAEASTTA